MKRSWIALSFFVVATLAGLLTFADRYSSAGNGYSEYSSLRTDPKGAKVLYDAFAQTGGLHVSRSFSYLQDLRVHGATIFVIGFSSSEEEELEALEKAAQGNRIVVALASEELRRWNIKRKKSEGNQQCAFTFEHADSWTKLNPCAVERSFASGHVVLLADPRPLTNEGLVADRNTSFLSQIAGPNAQIIFDESHLGMVETGSALGLARKYHLQGLLWGLATLAAVLIWKTAQRFPPPAPEENEPSAVTGRDARAGFLSLLQRHIPPDRLIEECVREWRRTSPRKDVSPAVPKADPVAAYRAIQRELTP